MHMTVAQLAGRIGLHRNTITNYEAGKTEPSSSALVDIAGALGCHPSISVDKRLDGAERVGEHKTSMLQDLEKDKPLELDVILAAVVELADLTGVKAPTLRAVHAVADLLASKVGVQEGV